MRVYRQIYRKIKQYNDIVIAHHIGPDPDALGSAFGLKNIIKSTFPKKNVYVVGSSASKFKYLGIPDKVDEVLFSKCLLIVLDTPDLKRIDGVNPEQFKEVVKIDHHPFIEKFGDIEFIDASASSASQLVMELVEHTRLKFSKIGAMCLFTGLIADTDRFLYDYTTPKTFDLVSAMLKKTNLKFTKLYLPLYLRPLKDIRFKAYIMSNMVVTENGLAYIKITDDILEQYEVDAATAGNLINDFNYINEIIVWAFFSSDKINNNIRGSIRSRGPIINEILMPYGGGGHALAAGVRTLSFDIADEIIEKLDKICEQYQVNINDNKVDNMIKEVTHE